MNDTPQNGAKRQSGRRILFWLSCLALLVVFIVLALNWSGKSLWENYRRQWEAKGEQFDFASFVPKPVPDDRNFARAPIVASCYGGYLGTNGDVIAISPPDTNVVDRLKLEIYGDNRLVEMPTNGLGSWTRGLTSDLKVWQNYYRALAARTNLFPVPPQPRSPAADVLLALSKYDSAIEELRLAGRRPESRFPLNYESDRPSEILLPHLAMLKRCSQTLQLRAMAELQNGQSGQAMDDVKLMLRLTDSIRSEPFIISHLVRIAMVQMTLQPVWEGLAGHKWSDAQLADYKFSMRGERAGSIATIEHLRRKRDFQEMITADNDTSGNNSEDPLRGVAEATYHLIPASIFYQNELTIARMHQQLLLPIVDVERRIASPDTARKSEATMTAEFSHFSINTIFARLLLPAFTKAVIKYAYAQSAVDVARVAGALERYRLAQGEYPASLEALSPRFMEKIPHDIINGEPLHYHRTVNGKFLLYSVGWNGTDDNGVVVLNRFGRMIDLAQGDWVWPGAISGSQ